MTNRGIPVVMLAASVALLFTGAACFAPGRGFSRGGESLPPARPARFVMTITLPDDDGVFGMTSFKGLVSDSVYVAMLERAAAAQAKVAAAQAKVAAAQMETANTKVESANTKVDLAQQKARANKLQNDLMHSNTQRLIVIGHIDLRAILKDVLPRDKGENNIEGWLKTEQDRRHVTSAAHAAGGREHQPLAGAFSAFRLMGTTLLLRGRGLLTACLAFAELRDALPS